MQKEHYRTLLMSAGRKRILVCGDLILDRFVWGHVDRISPEAPVQVVNVRREDLALGGAANVAHNLALLGCDVGLVGLLGDDEHGRTLLAEMDRDGINHEGVLVDPNRPTITKTRVIAGTQQIVRIDHETVRPMPADLESRCLNFLESRIGSYDLVVVSDYRKGMLTDGILMNLIAVARRRGVRTFVDPKREDFSVYAGATLIKPNLKEAESATRMAIRTDEDAVACARDLQNMYDFDAVLITRGKDGMTLVENGTAHRISSSAQEVFDVTGAGDTVTAYLAYLSANGLCYADAAAIANLAAGVAVSRVGTVGVTREDVLHQLEDQTSGARKILTADELAALLPTERRDRRIVFTNGCFDILHVGHITLLNRARALGDRLIVGLNSDASIRRIKGEKRPIVSELERAHIVSALESVDYVVLFDEDTPLELIKKLKPDVLVKGADYTVDRVVGHDVVTSYGGRVELVDLVAGFSTTNIVESILKQYRQEPAETSNGFAHRSLTKAQQRLKDLEAAEDRMEKAIRGKNKEARKAGSTKTRKR